MSLPLEDSASSEEEDEEAKETKFTLPDGTDVQVGKRGGGQKEDEMVKMK